jgi:4-aminobutyrate aminotransferase-like enzyme
LVPPPGYLKSLRDIAHANGALFIVDEAQTGFGRTGKWFAIEHHGAEPDILSLSKSVGNGFPVAAVTATAAIVDQVVGNGLWNLSSHQSDPLSAAAVLAVIDIVREEGLLARATESGNYFMDRLRDLATRRPIISNVRGQGLMIGFDLPPESQETGEMATAFMYGCRQRGVHLTYGYGNYNIRIIPPLVISRAEIDFAMEAIEGALKDLEEKADPQKYWPDNPHTRRLLEQHPFQRLVSRWWRSSPETWAEKGASIVKRKLGKR